VLLQRAARVMLERGEDRASCLLNLAAWSVARHHSAMECRHPSDLARLLRGELKDEWLAGKCKRFYAMLERALSSVRVEAVTEAIPEELRGTWLSDVISEAVGSLRGEEGKVLRSSLEHLSLHVNGSPMFCELDKDTWTSLVEVSSGALIVSDILVASRERRSSDDGLSRAYIRAWERELGVEREWAPENGEAISEVAEVLRAIV